MTKIPGRQIRNLLLLIFLIFNHLTSVFGQQPTAASSTSVRPKPGTPPADFSKINFVLSGSPEISTPDPDTLPDANFRQYDPARRQKIDFGNLGNLGTAARPLFFETRPRLGFDAGVHANDLYLARPENLKFYRNAKSLSDVRYSRGLKQDDGEFAARFARTFTGGLNFSLDFRNINQLGQYRYQRAKHNALAVGGWLPIGKRYDVFLIFVKNTSKQEENGGILDDSDFGNASNISGPTDILVRWSDEKALSRHAGWDARLVHHLKIAGRDKLDSAGQIGRAGRKLVLSHTMDWSRQSYKFADENLENDTAFGIFNVDDRGIRHFLEIKKVENQLSLATFKPRKDGRSADRLAVGLLHRWFYRVWQEPELTVFSNVFLTGDLKFSPSEKIDFSANGNLGVLKNIGEYQISGKLKLNFGKAGEFRAGLLSQRFPPSLLSEKVFVSKRLIWQNDFQKPVENSLSASYAIPAIGFEMTGQTTLINNFIYFDANARATQTTQPVQISQISASENLHFGSFHFDNTLAFQTTNRAAVLHLPKWFSKNSLYFSGKIFKKAMLFDAGVDFRTNGSFAPDGYQPVVWQFYLTADSIPNPKPYTWLDAFVAFKVSNFRVFFRFENVSNLFWDKTTPFYQTLRYPQPPAAFRIGIRWRFLDGNVSEGAENQGDGNNKPPSGIGGRRPF